LLVSAIIFGVLWLVVETAVKLGDRLTNRKS
jgi:hypothetical protein